AVGSILGAVDAGSGGTGSGIATMTFADPIRSSSFALIVAIPTANACARPAAEIETMLGGEDDHATRVVTSVVVLSDATPSAVNCRFARGTIVIPEGATRIAVNVGSKRRAFMRLACPAGILLLT